MIIHKMKDMRKTRAMLNAELDKCEHVVTFTAVATRGINNNNNNNASGFEDSKQLQITEVIDTTKVNETEQQQITEVNDD